MKVSAVGCTSLRPSQSSFKSKEYDENGDYIPAHKHSKGDLVKKLIIAGSVATAGTIMTKGISYKLLNQIKNDNKFAEAIGKKVVEGFTYIEKKIHGLNPDNKLQLKVMTFSDNVFDKFRKFASKGLDESAKAEAKAVNGIKRGLSYLAGGATAVESFKDTDHDKHINSEEVGDAIVKIAKAATTAGN